MHILVTGAGGFCGGHIVESLLQDGHTVDAYTGRRGRRIPWGPRVDGRQMLRQYPGDLLGSTMRFPDRVDVVIHAAASSPAPNTAPNFTHDNQAVTERLAEMAVKSGAKLFVYLSSLSVYGPITEPVLTEAYRPNPQEPYGRSKLQGELALCDQPYAVLRLRLPAVIGPGAKRNWLARIKGSTTPVPVYNPGAPFNNALHVSDLTAFIKHLIAWRDTDPLPTDVVNLASDGATTVREAVRIMTGNDPVQVEGGSSFTISIEAAKRYGFAPMDITAALTRYAGE